MACFSSCSGVGSLLLPMFDLQFRLMEFVDPYQPWAGLLVGVIGAVLVGMGLQRSRAAATTASAATAAAAAAPAATPAPAEPAPAPSDAPASAGDPPTDAPPA